MILLQSVALYVTPIAGVLDLEPPNLNDLLVALACVIAPVLIVELAKAIGRR